MSFRLPALPPLIVASSLVAHAQIPLEDIGFTPTTPLPDGDLIVVRERAYGAGGVDLTPYGIGTGSDEYIQSFYFRFFVGGGNQSVAAVNGVVVFPDGVNILGFVTSGAQLGGANDDGMATQTDGIFGITNPDDYSEQFRGFEAGTGEEFVCQVQDNAFVFLLSITFGVDDFRVIVDYGDAWPTNGAFALDTFGGVAIGSGTPQPGIRVGDDTNPIVLGSGDFGEAGRLSPIPITSTSPPVAGPALTLRPRDQVYIVRDTGGDTSIDGFQALRRFPVPSRGLLSSPGTPVGLTSAVDGFLYTVGSAGGFGVFDPVSRNTLTYTIEDRTGANTALCDATGSRELFIVRDTSGATMVDRFDLSTFEFAPGPPLSVPGTVVGVPVGIEEAGGLLYVLGGGGGFAELDPATGVAVSMPLSPPNGAYEGIVRGAAGAALFMVRDTSGDTAVDRFDLTTGVTTYGWSTFPDPGVPVDISTGPLGRLYVVGVGTTGPAGLIALDGTTGAPEFYTDCLDFPGSNRGLAYPDTSVGMDECGPAEPNSSGASAWVSLQGSSIAGGNPLEVAAWDLPPSQFGYFLTGMTPGFIVGPGGSQGNLCLTGSIGRYAAQVQNSGTLGQMRIPVDTLALPLSPPVAAAAGETWYFQAWFRDLNPGVTSNFTGSVSIRFQ